MFSKVVLLMRDMTGSVAILQKKGKHDSHPS